MLEKRINDSTAEQSDVEEKIKNLEGMQISLVHFVEKVWTTSSDIERTAAIWLPKYEATSHIVNELSFKVEQMTKSSKEFAAMKLILRNKLQGLLSPRCPA
jgi:hypothetical protein